MARTEPKNVLNPRQPFLVRHSGLRSQGFMVMGFWTAGVTAYIGFPTLES